MGSLSILQWIFPTQESNWDLLHCRRILYQMSYQESPSLKRDQSSTKKITFILCTTKQYKLSQMSRGFPGGSVVMDPPAKAGDLGSIPLGREDPLEEEMAAPLQYSCLENPTDRGTWWATVHWGTKESDMTEWLSMHARKDILEDTSCMGRNDLSGCQQWGILSCISYPVAAGQPCLMATLGRATSWLPQPLPLDPVSDSHQPNSTRSRRQ